MKEFGGIYIYFIYLGNFDGLGVLLGGGVVEYVVVVWYYVEGF